MQEVVIVTPIYKSDLSESEQISINHLRCYCAHFPKVIIHPLGLKFNFDTSDFIKIPLSPRHFKNIDSYSRMCLNPRFYRLFSEYRYMLIYQLDAYVFKDELGYWCQQNYSYIGGPWIKTTTFSRLVRSFNRRMQKWRWRVRLNIALRYRGTGANGGFCLRNIEHCRQVLEAKTIHWSKVVKFWQWAFHDKRKFMGQLFLAYWRAKKTGRSVGAHMRRICTAAEDYYFCQNGSLLNKNFIVAPPAVAGRFSMERENFEVTWDLNGGQMPFGAHGCFRTETDQWIKHFDFIGLGAGGSQR